MPLGAADISPNPHQITRIVEADSATTLSEFANNGELRKRGEGKAESGVKYNGFKVMGEVSHETCPGWVMGRGVLYVQPRGTMVIFR